MTNIRLKPLGRSDEMVPHAIDKVYKKFKKQDKKCHEFTKTMGGELTRVGILFIICVCIVCIYCDSQYEKRTNANA